MGTGFHTPSQCLVVGILPQHNTKMRYPQYTIINYPIRLFNNPHGYAE